MWPLALPVVVHVLSGSSWSVLILAEETLEQVPLQHRLWVPFWSRRRTGTRWLCYQPAPGTVPLPALSPHPSPPSYNGGK